MSARHSALAFVLILAAAGLAAEAKYHIGIVTGTVTQSEDELRGAESR